MAFGDRTWLSGGRGLVQVEIAAHAIFRGAVMDQLAL